MEFRTRAVNLKHIWYFSTSDSFIYRQIQMYLTYDIGRGDKKTEKLDLREGEE